MKQDADTVIKSHTEMNNHEYYMKLALKEAKLAFKKGEIPVGCVIVRNGEVIAKGHNLRHTKKEVLAHAETIAIARANKKLGTWILDDCTMYVTLEPCTMCAGAILQARFKKLVFGAPEPKFGACGSVVNLLDNEKFNHQVEIESGILKEESAELLKSFFQIVRQNKKNLI